MSKDDEKRNQDGPEFTLEEILAEYSVKEEREPEGRIPIPMDPEPPRRKVVPFPGAAQEDAPEEDDYPEGDPFATDSVDEPTRRINLNDLKFGRNYSGEN